MGRESITEICKTNLTQSWNQKLQGLEAELKTIFFKIKDYIVQVYNISSGLLFKVAEHYSQIYGINLQTVIKGMTEISISIFKTSKKRKKK